MKIKDMKEPILAIDLGGTKIASAIVSDGKVAYRDYRLTRAAEGVDSVILNIASAIEELLAKSRLKTSDLSAISIASAGAIDTANGLVTSSPNLPGWQDVPLRNRIKERFATDTFLINDASAAALGEHRYGAGRGTRNLVYITVSTGIGGGIIIDGELYLGTSGAAGEIGHTTIDANGPPCYCGNRGCLEVLASGTAIAREAIKAVKDGRPSILKDIIKGDIDKITAKEVSQAASRGDTLALKVIGQAAYYLGIGMVNVTNIFNPEIIVIGGGVSRMGELIFKPVRKIVSEQAFGLSARAVRIVPFELGDDSGVLGAAAYARCRLGLD